MTIGERIKTLRKKLDLTQKMFADRIGMKRNSIAQIELGRNTSEQTIFSICREFNVNEDWLRNGNGDMFLPVDRENEISKMVKGLLNEEANSFKSRFITMLAGLSVSDWERLESEAKKLLDVNAELSATDSEAMTVEEAEAAYIKSRSKNAQKTDVSAMNTTTDGDKAVNQ